MESVLFRIREESKTIGICAIGKRCPHCEETQGQILLETTQRHVFFFIPMPFASVSYRVFCPICRGMTEISVRTAQKFIRRIVAQEPGTAITP